MRLVSQEGMEAWQKKLNEVLRMGNGFANAGAIGPMRTGENLYTRILAVKLQTRPHCSTQYILTFVVSRTRCAERSRDLQLRRVGYIRHLLAALHGCL